MTTQSLMQYDAGYDSGLTFPKIKICSQSIHSRQKMAKHYPFIDFRDLMTLYGTFYNISNITQKSYLHLYKTNMSAITEIETDLEKNAKWLYLNSIDLNEMFTRTRPIYIIRVCRLNNLDCKNDWKFERGIMVSFITCYIVTQLDEGQLSRVRPISVQ